MANFSAQDFIAKARGKNIPDSAIYSYLQSKGLLNQTNAPDFKATPGNVITGPTDNSAWSKYFAKPITQAGVGVGSVIGQTGLGLGDLATKAVGGIAGMFGAKGIQQGAQKVSGDIEGMSNALYSQPTMQKDKATIPGMVGTGVGSLATFASPGGIEAKGAQAVQDITDATKMGPIATGIAKILTKSSIGATSMGIIGKAQGGSGKGNAILGAVGGAVGETLSVFGKPFAEALQAADFKMNPLQASKAANKIAAASTFMTENGILGSTAAKAEKLTNISNSFEETLQKSLPKTFAVSKKEIAESAERQLKELIHADPAEHGAATNAVRKGLSTLGKNQGSSINGAISTEDALAGKRSWGSQAFKTSKNTDPNVSSKGAFILETAYQKALNDAMEKSNSQVQIPENLEQYFGGKSNVTLPEFNKVYSTLISAKNFTRLSEGKTGSSLMGRLASVYIGEIIGQGIMPGPIGKVGGIVAGELGSTVLPGALRSAGEYAYAGANAIPAITKGVGATTRALTPPTQ